MEDRKGQDHGPRKGQAFLLAEAALRIATSSLTLIRNLPARRGSPSRPPGRGKQEEAALKLCLGAREGAPSPTGPWQELQRCWAEPAELLGMFRIAVVEGRCPASLRGPRTQTHQVPQSVGQQRLYCPSSPVPPRASPKAQGCHHKQLPSQIQAEQRQPQAVS